MRIVRSVWDLSLEEDALCLGDWLDDCIAYPKGTVFVILHDSRTLEKDSVVFTPDGKVVYAFSEYFEDSDGESERLVVPTFGFPE